MLSCQDRFQIQLIYIPEAESEVELDARPEDFRRKFDKCYSQINRFKENEALILYLKQQGAFTGLEIKHLAACKIQSGF